MAPDIPPTATLIRRRHSRSPGRGSKHGRTSLTSAQCNKFASPTLSRRHEHRGFVVAVALCGPPDKIRIH
ncbi:hypothetical protein PGT21_000849 [Puccinia graminis f. sp. tritici]|uniref:Uncharacterized protein n=1 Tax=Puccinia graminis f. sp. tritici TaxID=56615 RepID=A0A5B0QE70_PUCGR|nr:hypothetical protein PGT21_000849 [Puccinia graminis f. sp. tritici]KAA1111412.1 hypothetical protein PGTUg99_006920 [Puccinia graminis f. sp. tritici]